MSQDTVFQIAANLKVIILRFVLLIQYPEMISSVSRGSTCENVKHLLTKAVCKLEF